MNTTLVSQLYSPSLRQALEMSLDTPLEEVVRRFAADGSLRSIFLVDGEGILHGVVDRRSLMDWARLKLDIPLAQTMKSLATVRRLVLATRAREIMAPDSHQVAVQGEDTLDRALDRMARFELLHIPVVDSQQRVIGDLRLNDILALALAGPAEQ